MADDGSSVETSVAGLPSNLATLLNVISEQSDVRSWHITQHQPNSQHLTVQITFGPNHLTRTNPFATSNGRIRVHHAFPPSSSLRSNGSRLSGFKFGDIWRSTTGVGSTLRLYNRFGTTPEANQQKTGFHGNVWSVFTLGVLLISVIVYLVAFCTHEWSLRTMDSGMSARTTKYGLWRRCRENDDCDGVLMAPWMATVRSVCTVGLIGLGLATFLGIVNIFLRIPFRKILLPLEISIIIIAGIMIVVGFTIFGVNEDSGTTSDGVISTKTHYGYSFALACVTGPCVLLAGVFATIDFLTL